MPSLYSTHSIKKQALLFVSLTTLFLFAFVLRIHHLDFESLWIDELRQVSYYPHTLVDIIYNAASQTQPPLDYWIGHLVVTFSNSDFAVRLPSALFGTGSVLLITILVGRICGWPIAIGTGLVAALLPFSLRYSQEARPYAIAIFFLLAVLWSLDRLLSSKIRSLGHVIILFFFSLAFLYSRTLVPLVVLIVLIFALALRFCILTLRQGVTLRDGQDRIILAGIVFGVAIFLYLPIFYLILSKGGDYTYGAAHGFGWDSITTGIRNFDLSPLWKAFVVQTRPLTIPLLILLLISPYFAWKSGLYAKNALWIHGAVILIGASLLHIFVFQAKSHLPFRPRYAIYLLPMVLMLSSPSVHGLWSMTGEKWCPRKVRLLFISFVVILIFVAGRSALISKSAREKTDWRGMAAYLGATCGKGQLLIFDSLAPYGGWEPRPTIYAFPRYYRGKSPLTYIAQLPYLSRRLLPLPLEPVLILHHPAGSPILQKAPTGNSGKGTFLRTENFKGLTVIRLERRSNHLALDTYTILSKMLLQLPQNTSLVEPYLASADLAHFLGLEVWKDYLVKADSLVSGKNKIKVRQEGERIRTLVSESLGGK